MHAGLHGVDCLEPCHEITPGELQRAASEQGVQVRPHDLPDRMDDRLNSIGVTGIKGVAAVLGVLRGSTTGLSDLSHRLRGG